MDGYGKKKENMTSLELQIRQGEPKVQTRTQKKFKSVQMS
jgi:hypothetical protein